MSGTARRVLTWAAHQVRTMEKPEGSNKQPYARIAGHANGQAWCATFIVAGLKANNVPLVRGTNSAFTPTMRNGFNAAGRLHERPRPGDAGFVFYQSLGRIGHVFFVERVEGDFVVTIEGNTNLNAGPQGVGVFRHRRRWRGGGEMIRGFGRPPYGAPPASKRPVVHVSNLVVAAMSNPIGPQGSAARPKDTRVVEAALVAEGLLSPRWARDGSFGSTTVTAYAQWQRRLGFTGDDANGVPGLETLQRLGRRNGFIAKE